MARAKQKWPTIESSGSRRVIVPLEDRDPVVLWFHETSGAGKSSMLNMLNCHSIALDLFALKFWGENPEYGKADTFRILNFWNQIVKKGDTQRAVDQLFSEYFEDRKNLYILEGMCPDEMVKVVTDKFRSKSYRLWIAEREC